MVRMMTTNLFAVPTVSGFEPPGTQAQSFAYALKVRVRP